MLCYRCSQPSLPPAYLGIVIALAMVVTSFAGEPAAQEKKPSKPANEKVITCFDGETLDGWKVTNFGGEGEVTVKDGAIMMDYGYSLTGITYQRPVPKVNYEISLEAALSAVQKKDAASEIFNEMGTDFIQKHLFVDNFAGLIPNFEECYFRWDLGSRYLR